MSHQSQEATADLDEAQDVLADAVNMVEDLVNTTSVSHVLSPSMNWRSSQCSYGSLKNDDNYLVLMGYIFV